MIENVVSANEFRTKLDMTPIPSMKHKLVIWPEGPDGPRQRPYPMMTFKCVKCTKGALTLPVECVRALVAGDSRWIDFLLGVAWGSWNVCREDLARPLNVPLEG